MLKFTTKPGQQVWFTSDYHDFHRNLCRGTSQWVDKRGCRDFDTLEEMERAVVDNYNRLVKPDDIVFNLGDLIFGDKGRIQEFLSKLRCRNIYFLCGNHDDWMYDKLDVQSMFTQFHKFGLEVSINRRLFVLNHYALKVWRDYHKGSIHLFGHSHGSLPDDQNSRSFDCGVDTKLWSHQEFSPYSLDEVVKICDSKMGFKAIDHHGRSPEIR